MDDRLQDLAIDERSVPLTPAQKDELDRRLYAYAVDGNRGRPAGDVIADIRRRL